VIASLPVAVAFTEVFVVTGVFHLRRCALLWSAGPVAGRDLAVELGHLLMSLGMLAMVWAWVGSVSRWLQLVVFGLLAILFVARVRTARAGAGLHTGRPAFDERGAADGRAQRCEDSPAGWPQRWRIDGEQLRTDGCPTAQWSRRESGRSDDLGTARR
jgi:hypothetical protein